MIEAKHTSHSGAISKSGGRLATSAKRLVSLIARLSNDAMRVARDSTNASRSASGDDRLTYPYSSARSPGMSSAPRSTAPADRAILEPLFDDPPRSAAELVPHNPLNHGHHDGGREPE